ncbi:MAG TPA: NTP transferase domain-containing protein [Methanomassiliicoccales archaeon]|nr:NTP transferase domain-containing protein [Methanomassiliicoccales archaeon]
MSELGREKPLVKVNGRTLVERAIAVAKASRKVRQTYVSTSPNAPRTEYLLDDLPVRVLHTFGEGYVKDLHLVMSDITEDHVLILPVDMPLLTVEDIDGLIDEYYRRGEPSLTVTLRPELIRSLGLTVTHSEVINDVEVTFCGVSVVNRKEMLKDDFIAGSNYLTDNIDFAVNVNTAKDIQVAEELLRRRGE